MDGLGEVNVMCSDGDKLWECICAGSSLKPCVFN